MAMKFDPDSPMSKLKIEIPDQPPVPEHDCCKCSRYTIGPLGWAWYCQVCGSIAEIDEMPEG